MPGDGSASDPHPAGTVELVHVTAGELTLVVDGVEHRVPAGCQRLVRGRRPAHATATTAPSREMVMAVSVPPVR